MKIPSFSEFKKSANIDSMSYDFEHSVKRIIESSGEVFTAEQLAVITHCCLAAAGALLQSYHEWLSETLDP